MNPRDGGPAFPLVVEGFLPEPGVSVRDWFASDALKVTLREESFAQGESSLAIDVARAYRVADLMLAERAKEPQA